MGYTTEFYGEFTLDRSLDPKLHAYLNQFNESRRMKRKVDSKYGVDGEFYVKDNTNGVIDRNEPPSTQPGLWCQWRPSEDGCSIVWDEGEGFYNYADWLVYYIKNFIIPYNHVLNGEVDFEGEDSNDFGKLIVIDNVLYVKEGRKTYTEQTIYKNSQLIDALDSALENQLLQANASPSLDQIIGSVEE